MFRKFFDERSGRAETWTSEAAEPRLGRAKRQMRAFDNAPKGQQAASPGQRPGYSAVSTFALKGQKHPAQGCALGIVRCRRSPCARLCRLARPRKGKSTNPIKHIARHILFCIIAKSLNTHHGMSVSYGVRPGSRYMQSPCLSATGLRKMPHTHPAMQTSHIVVRAF